MSVHTCDNIAMLSMALLSRLRVGHLRIERRAESDRALRHKFDIQYWYRYQQESLWNSGDFDYCLISSVARQYSHNITSQVAMSSWSPEHLFTSYIPARSWKREVPDP